MAVPSAVDTLRRELSTLLEELSAVLAAEYAALRARDGERLEAAAARKLELVTALDAATGNYCRAGGKLAPAEFGALQHQAAACARANRVNGGTIELNRNLVARLLDTLRGGARAITTYDASGRLHRRGAARPVGHA